MAKSVQNIIVGSGLAGLNLAFQLHLRNEGFVIIDPCPDVTSTSVAAGVYNPIVPRRQILSWKAEELVEALVETYRAIEDWLDVKVLDHDLPIWHPITSVHHLSEWKTAIENGSVAPFVSRVLPPSASMKPEVLAVIEVRNGGRLKTAELLHGFRSKLEEERRLIKEELDFDQLVVDHSITYGPLSAERIFFCDGHRVTENPLFNWVPMKPSKGQVLTLQTQAPLQNVVYSKNCFYVKDGSSNWKLGATFEWENIHSGPDGAGKEDLLQRVSEFMDVDNEVVGHTSAIRPTMHDRRPMIGAHPQHGNVFMLNGLGTKGTMLAPWCAKQLCEHVFAGGKLNEEVDISRTFRKYYPFANG